MQIREIMKRLIHTVNAETTLVQASCCMRDENIGFLPVVSEAGLVAMNTSREMIENIGFLPIVEEAALVGVVTDRDIIVSAIASGMDPGSTPVSEIMTKCFAVCHEGDDISDAAVVMKQKKVRCLFVLDREGQTIGIVSIDDIASVEPCLSGEILQTIQE